MQTMNTMTDTDTMTSRDDARKQDVRHVEHTISDIKSGKLPESVVRNLRGECDNYIMNKVVNKRRV
jgi:hypothetical protein